MKILKLSTFSLILISSFGLMAMDSPEENLPKDTQSWGLITLLPTEPSRLNVRANLSWMVSTVGNFVTSSLPGDEPSILNLRNNLSAASQTLIDWTSYAMRRLEARHSSEFQRDMVGLGINEEKECTRLLYNSILEHGFQSLSADALAIYISTNRAAINVAYDLLASNNTKENLATEICAFLSFNGTFLPELIIKELNIKLNNIKEQKEAEVAQISRDLLDIK